MIDKFDLAFATFIICLFLIAQLLFTGIVWAEVKELREELKKRL